MTFGNQNTESEAHSQLDYALANGINFIDTAEMYPIGGNAQIFGSTERFIVTRNNKISASERKNFYRIKSSRCHIFNIEVVLTSFLKFT